MDIAQILVDTVVLGSVYVLVAVGLTMTYGLLKFANFAHAEFITFGAYVGLVAVTMLNLGLVGGGILAFILTGLLGILGYLLVFKPLQKRGANSVELMIASIGVGLIIRHILQQIFGAPMKTYGIVRHIYEIGSVRITNLEILEIICAFAFIIIFHIILHKTKLGKAMRAVSNNPSLAMASGINVDKIILWVWFIGAGAAGLGGMLFAANTRVIPTFGWEILLPVFAVVVLGGIGSVYGTFLAAFIIALAENIGVVLLSELGLSTGYRPAVAFIILILVLLIRPQGLISLKTRVG
ncbi:branched-chain amino acid ABC transporter permease [Methanotorris igneus]|uniref:ABC-type transporter, integral membrane subunit n=1 Tax=Methanotorris igneus (strain DSM 5666 / JCM 11834 / Kol 5) TaxID=880724 RepID=F6BB54_METIK|nr:branched-chain amino acid ABC transporter permease [Methanotorris igneus]AEF95939.1 ABC-type transporter, integral membrane subunit [Methanotorris igneus Kol 5]